VLYDVDIEASACVLSSRYAMLCYADILSGSRHVDVAAAINESINTHICIVQNKQSKMSSNALTVSALEQVSFQLFAESVKTHSSSTDNTRICQYAPY